MEEGIEVKRGPLQRNLTKIGLVYHFCNKAIKQKPKSIIYMNVNFANFFGSVRSSGCHFVRPSVCLSVQHNTHSTLEHSIFLFVAYIIKQTSWWLQDNFRITSGWLPYDFLMTSWWLQEDYRDSEDSESIQRAFREHSESTQRSLK